MKHLFNKYDFIFNVINNAPTNAAFIRIVTIFH